MLLQLSHLACNPASDFLTVQSIPRDRFHAGHVWQDNICFLEVTKNPLMSSLVLHSYERYIEL